MSPTARNQMANGGEYGRDPETIARNIDATRSDVDQTLDALQAKLSPGQMLDRALGYVRENGGELAGNLGNAVKQNPLPMMLAGVGIAWMMASGGTTYRARSRAPGATTSAGGQLSETASRTRDAASQAADRVSGAASQMADRASEAASHAADRLSGAADATWKSVSQGADSISRGASGLAHSASARVQRARESASQLLDEQPLLLGALGLAIGALIGAALPSTETEDRLLGAARDRGLQRVKEAGQQVGERVKDTARDAAREATEEPPSGANPAGPWESSQSKPR